MDGPPPRRPAPGEPVPVGAALERWRRHLGVARPSTMARVTESWGAIAGGLASEVVPSALVDGVLRTSTVDPAVAEAVRRRAGAWIEVIDGLVGEGEVVRIEVRLRR